MSTKTPPASPYAPGDAIEAGVIEDARARQRRQRWTAALLLSAAIAVGALLVFGGGNGSGGSGGGNGGSSHPFGAGGSGAGSHAGGVSYSAAPRSQPGYFNTHIYRFVCSLAAPNRDLPARAGCVSVKRGDIDGDGRPDLVILYANLSSQRIGRDYVPKNWTLEVARASGQITRIGFPANDEHPLLLRMGNINSVPGDEIFVQPTEISSGSPLSIYSLRNEKLNLAGTFSVGGDSAVRERFYCQAKPTPRITQQTMSLIGSTIYGKWQWTTTIYVWHGATLVRARQTSGPRTGLPAIGPKAFGAGCGTLAGPAGDQ